VTGRRTRIQHGVQRKQTLQSIQLSALQPIGNRRLSGRSAAARAEADSAELRRKPVHTRLQLDVLGYEQTEPRRRQHISRDDYKNGYALYAFDRTANLGEDDHFNLVKHGNVRLALKFADALAETVTIIAFAEQTPRTQLRSNWIVIATCWWTLAYEHGRDSPHAARIAAV